jgi:hemerythrin
MNRYEWDSALETGVEAIDAQHRGLFALADKLADAVEICEPGDDALADALYGLSDYCVQHFADEEALMAEAGYPEFAPHRALHQTLASRTMGLMTRYFNGEDVKPDEVAPFVVDWLTMHIKEADMRFVTWLGRPGG